MSLSTGKTLLIVNGYTYNKDYSTKNGTRWVCNNQRLHNCTVYVNVNAKYELTSITNEHTHEPLLCKLFQERMM